MYLMLFSVCCIFSLKCSNVELPQTSSNKIQIVVTSNIFGTLYLCSFYANLSFISSSSQLRLAYRYAYSGEYQPEFHEYYRESLVCDLATGHNIEFQ